MGAFGSVRGRLLTCFLRSLSWGLVSWVYSRRTLSYYCNVDSTRFLVAKLAGRNSGERSTGAELRGDGRHYLFPSFSPMYLLAIQQGQRCPGAKGERLPASAGSTSEARQSLNSPVTPLPRSIRLDSTECSFVCDGQHSPLPAGPLPPHNPPRPPPPSRLLPLLAHLPPPPPPQSSDRKSVV